MATDFDGAPMATKRSPFADYLRARRNRLKPEDVGLPVSSGRRVPGLRREEVATLAGISPDYYLRIEQGRDHNLSDQVLASVARALRLNDLETRYLFRLARPELHALAAEPRPLSPAVVTLLEQWSHTPAYVFDRNLDVLAANQLMLDLAPEIVAPGTNLVETVAAGYAVAMSRGEPPATLDKWAATFHEMVAALRYYSDPEDPRLQEIVGALALGHQNFREVWALHDAHPYTSGANRAWIEPLGWVDFRWQALELPGNPRRFIVTHLAEPGSRAYEAIAHLAATRAAGLQNVIRLPSQPD